MPQADTIEKRIRAERADRFAALSLPDDWIAPNYFGRSIVNVPASVVRLFGGDISTPPLDPSILHPLAEGVDRVVLVFKKKRRKGYRVKRGHRQLYTEIEISEIV